jgi:hypothetical protein
MASNKRKSRTDTHRDTQKEMMEMIVQFKLPADVLKLWWRLRRITTQTRWMIYIYTIRCYIYHIYMSHFNLSLFTIVCLTSLSHLMHFFLTFLSFFSLSLVHSMLPYTIKYIIYIYISISIYNWDGASRRFAYTVALVTTFNPTS